MIEPVAVVTEYLRAFYGGDLATARALAAEDLTFEGPFVAVKSREAFFESAAPLARVVRGARVVRQWADGADVCTLFELALETPDGAGVVLMSEWHVVSAGRIVAGRVVFDTAAFRALVPARPPA